jgi:hypothetical protein
MHKLEPMASAVGERQEPHTLQVHKQPTVEALVKTTQHSAQRQELAQRTLAAVAVAAKVTSHLTLGRLAVQVSALLSTGAKMAHFAKIENGIVTNIVVVDNAHEANGQEYLNGLGLEGTWVQTSYNANFGKKFAAVGDTYVASTGNFKPAQPHPSWKWSATDWAWSAPKAPPSDGKQYVWNEEVTDWVEI